MFHDPEANHLAAFVDLKYEDVGIAFGAEHVWETLWGILQNLGIIHSDMKMPRGDKPRIEVTQAITDWIESNGGRLLLLLDEADAFLAEDLKNDFRESTQLKGLMDATDRSFKVVLCGLHNVLRNTERANHPLAHFGEPISVGPLLNNGDLDQARALAKEPMESAGYKFESDNLITRILLWTNYYPSLIQLSGEALLQHLRQLPRSQVPGVITEEELEAVLRRGQFRDYIRSRFLLTLQLDPRYELIAYTIAFELQDEKEKDISGFTGASLLVSARDHWPEGFEISEREFGTLLQEMCTLGVLRQRNPNAESPQYSFRNPNVRRLLGDGDEVVDVLSRSREKPEVFDAATYHAQFDKNKIGPLTFEQETLLKKGGRVAVLCRNGSVNGSYIGDFLESRISKSSVCRRRPSQNITTLSKLLSARRPDRETHIFLVDEEAPWTTDWLMSTSKLLRRLKKGSLLRVVFEADPNHLFNVITDTPDIIGHRTHDWLEVISLKPWTPAFLRKWCSDFSLSEELNHIDELLDITGGWPNILDLYGENTEKGWEAKSKWLKGQIDEKKETILNDLGFSSPASRREFAPLISWDENVLQEEQAEFYAEYWNDVNEEQPAVSGQTLRYRMLWAECLGIIEQVSGGYSINSLVRRLLSS